MRKESIKPLADFILVKIEKQDKETASGIILPDSASQERPQEGRVIAVGNGKKIQVKKNQKVIFNRYGGTEVKINKEEYLIIKNEDILATVE
jgi:chaperonin GroES